ncbi:hypothetical protein BD289DRAFT_176751 [Coniella lustricola]|uniref:Uncharacterized protein n=1 Tax=Coniella lustricola TaxID=2025994 RepID=A0A2T2ZTK3_9PEZI|nr:hypothetical protein BD289DRAFT_176751 [Coniella lustricola]
MSSSDDGRRSHAPLRDVAGTVLESMNAEYRQQPTPPPPLPPPPLPPPPPPTVYARLRHTLKALEAIDQQLDILRRRVKALREEHTQVARRISAYCLSHSITLSRPLSFPHGYNDNNDINDIHNNDNEPAAAAAAAAAAAGPDAENWRNKFAAKDAGEVQRLTQRHAELQAQTVSLKDQIARLDEEYYAKWQACMRGLLELPGQSFFFGGGVSFFLFFFSSILGLLFLLLLLRRGSWFESSWACSLQ